MADLIVWVDTLPKSTDYLTAKKRYPAKHISNGAYKITADDNRETIINPLGDRHHLNGRAWNVEVSERTQWIA